MAVISFIVGILSVGDVGSGELLPVAARDEGSTFELARRAARMLEAMEDELGVMGATKTPGIVLFVGVCEDENGVSRAQGPLAPSGDMEGETGALGFGISYVCAIVDLCFLCWWMYGGSGLCYCALKREEGSS